jgi:hypothetical protein
VSFDVMLMPRPDSRWHLDAGDFVDAARSRWPEAQISDPIVRGGGEIMVMLSTEPGVGSRPLSATLSVDPDKDGYFSIQSGTSPEAAEMFAWVRDWLGPQQPSSILTTAGDGSLAEVPSGTTGPDVLRIIESLQ